LIQELNAGTPMKEVCRAFGVPYTTAALWKQRYAKGGYEALFGQPAARKASGEANADLRREAVLALKQAHPEYGTRRIRDVLKRFEAIGISETEVRRMLHEAELMKTPAPTPRPEPQPRRFERAEPNQLWQSDIFTFLLRRHDRIYVCAFMDDHSRFIVSCVVARHQKEFLARTALEEAIASYGAPQEVLTDNGRQYTAWRGTTRFEEELRRQGIRHIKSRPQHPQTLGKIERFWKTLWDEFLSRTVFANLEDCIRRLALYIDGYNFQRPHQSLEGMTPADRYFRAAAHVRAEVEAQVKANAIRLAQQQPAQKPFYIVGKLGDHDMTISAGRDGVRVRLGKEEPQTIPLANQEDADAADPQAPSTTHSAVALEEAGARRDRAAAHADGAERAEWREAGDGRDRGGGDLEGALLPARGEGAEGDPAGDGAWSAGGATDGHVDQDSAAGGAGEGAGEGQEAAGKDAADHAPGAEAGTDEDDGWQTEIGETWQERFAALGEGEGEGIVDDAGAGDLFAVARGEHPLTWPRKLAGASEGEHARLAEAAHEPELYAGAGDSEGAGGARTGDSLFIDGPLDGDASGGEIGPVAESFSNAQARGDGGATGGADAWEGWPAGSAARAEGAARAALEARARERGAAATRGDHRSADGSSGRHFAGPGADAPPIGEDEGEEE
jgi:transposase InsO family protein